MVATTGCAVVASNSALPASVSAPSVRAASMTMHCSPRQMPSSGTRFSRACRTAPSLPSIPRTPNPPGTRTPSTPSSSRLAPSGVSQSSLFTQRMCTLASLPNPPCRSASVTDRYASGRSMYLPTSAIVTSRAGLWTRRSSSSHDPQSTSRNGRSRRRTT